jgi:FkbM family methyltransferase
MMLYQVVQRFGRIRRLPVVRNVATWWLRNRDVRIPVGVGAGLRFNAGSSNPAYALGTNELPVQHALSAYLKPGHIFYDIGANVGFFTVIAARLVGSTGHVYAFEPLPDNTTRLRRNVELNGFRQVTVLEKAVSKAAGRGELQISRLSGGSSLSTVAPPADLQGTISIDLVSVDDLIAQSEVAAPNVVKIDVEGAELDVLLGMSRTMQTHRPVIIYEIDDSDADSFARKQEACQSLLRPLGYRVTLLEDSYPGLGWNVAHFTAVPASLE